MRKGLRKLAAVVLTAAMALSIGTPAFAADNSRNENAFYITENTTLGQIVQYTNPEGYAAMPAESRATLNETYVKDCAENNENVEATNQARVLWVEGRLLTNITNITKNSFDYSAGVTINTECPYAYVEAIIYDATTGELITSAYDSDYDTDYLLFTETADGLKSSYRYRFFVFGDIIPPEGFQTTVSNLNHQSYVTTARG